VVKLRASVLLPFLVAREATAGDGRVRTPEPMLMDDTAAVDQFDEVGRETGLNIPIYELCARSSSRLLPRGGTVLDLGSGSARYLAYLARRRPDAQFVGVELSDRMLELGRENIADQGLSDRLRLVRGDITDLREQVPRDVDLLSCVFALHHMPSGDHLARCLRHVAEVRRHGAAVLLFDIARLKHPRSFRRMFSALPRQKPLLERDALASEDAAWSFNEMSEALAGAGLGDLHHCLSRPLASYQLHWAPGRHERRGMPGDDWHELPAPREVRLGIRMVRSSFKDLP
jgi:SAM-dependent methyltransferase